MRLLHTLLLSLAIAGAATAAPDPAPVEGTLVRKGSSLGVRTPDGVVRLIRPKKHGLGSQVAHLLAVVPNGTYVKIKPRVRSAFRAIPFEFMSGRQVMLDVKVAADGRSVEVDGRQVRLHRRRLLEDESPSGAATSNETLIRSLAGRKVHAFFFALFDQKRRPSDLFLIQVRGRLSRDTQVTGAPGVKPTPEDHRLGAGGWVWFTEVSSNGYQRITYSTSSTDYRGGYVPSANVQRFMK